MQATVSCDCAARASLPARERPDRCELLWRELTAAGVLCADEYAQLREQVTEAGVAQSDALRQALGAARWDALIECLGPSAQARATRVLGFGYVLADFAAAPLALGEREREAVARLGALGQLIGGIYDHVMDARPGWRRILLPDRVLVAGAGGNSVLPRLFASIGPRISRLANRLVAEYFRQLQALPAAPGREPVRRSIGKVVLRMYRAERASLARARLSEREFRRKGALPFVLLGMPGWLVARALEPDRYLSHLRWLYRLGDFFAWLDDVIDLDEDIAGRQQNRLILREGNDAALPRRIAMKGRRVLGDWERACPAGALAGARRRALSLCAISWFGGSEAIARYRPR